VSEERLWIVDIGGGQVQLVRGIDALRRLISDRGLTKTSNVYVLSATAQPLGEVTEVRSVFESEADPGPLKVEPELELEAGRGEAPAQVVAPEPPAVAAPAALPSPVDDEEFALLDRPFDDGEYFEDPPRRWLRPAGVAAVLISLGVGGYWLVHPRSAPHAPLAAGQGESDTATLAASATAATQPAVATQAAPAAPLGQRESDRPEVVASAPSATQPAVIIQAAPAAPVAAERPRPTVASAAADPSPAEPALLAPDAQTPVRVSPATSRLYPELVAEGQRQFQGGHTGKAQALFEQALAETPQGNDALVGLAYVHLDRGKVRQAIALFERALAQDHGDPTALFGLAESHRQDGDRGAALAEFERFLTLRSTGSDADIARQLIQELASGG
jgi:hypothetical protein